jgi:hypothetical protein
VSSAVNFIWDPAIPTGRLLLVAVILVVLGLVPWIGKALVVLAQGLVDVIKMLANSKVLTDLAKLKPEQIERLPSLLERVRPPPDEIEPPPDNLGDLAQLHAERQPGDHRDPGAARG